MRLSVTQLGRFSLGLLLPYWTLAFIGTHLPGSTVQSLKRGWMLSLPHADKVAHALLYAGLSFLFVGFLRLVKKMGLTSSMTLAFATVSLYGMIDEYLQSFIPRRSMDVADWLADNIGAGIGIGLFLLVAQLWNTRKSPTPLPAANS